MERVRPEGSRGDRGGNLGAQEGSASLPAFLPQKLSLEQRTERLVQRSQALLKLRPCGPEGAKPLLGSPACSSTLDDPLVEWRLRRCRGEEPALDTPLVGRALLGSAARGSLQGEPPGRSRDPPEAPWPFGRHFCKHQGASSPQALSQEPLRQDPCWRPPDSCKTVWPTRSSSLDTLQGALYSQSRGSHHAPRQISSSCCAPLHQGAPPGGKRDSHEPLLQEPFGGAHDCLGALWCALCWKSRGSQDALWPAREVLPQPPRQGGPGLRSLDPREAPQPIRSSACDALKGAPWQQPLDPLGDPLLWMLRCHRRAVRGHLRAIETLLECPPEHPQPMVGPIKQ
ncbi:uncharacterized protein LOC129131958 isoform X1 [Agelaius phoeniceus]|uniref:uncharacterized protein LOC129131958 isoform X1 n=1 Tax=Agelaius phoeniceus TaxID=39638 RepID=UPI0040552408